MGSASDLAKAVRPQASEELALLRFLLSLTEAGNLKQLERRFREGIGRHVSAPMYGFNTLDPVELDLEHSVAVNVSDGFVTRYIRDAMDGDPLRSHAFATGRAAYNLALMDEEQWAATEVYRAAYSIHGIRHVVEAPILGADGEQIGGLHIANADPEAGIDASEIELVEVIGRVLGAAVGNLRAREELEIERDQAEVALALSGAAVAISSRDADQARLNDAARELLGTVEDADADRALPMLIARPAGDGGFSRRTEVRLRNGDDGVLAAHSTPIGDRGELATVLDLRGRGAGLCSAPLAALTRREAEVAVLVSEGLGDREIAAELDLSHHTVSQYVKRIYRKLEVDSRVALTRLLLGAPISGRARS